MKKYSILLLLFLQFFICNAAEERYTIYNGLGIPKIKRDFLQKTEVEEPQLLITDNSLETEVKKPLQKAEVKKPQYLITANSLKTALECFKYNFKNFKSTPKENAWSFRKPEVLQLTGSLGFSLLSLFYGVKTKSPILICTGLFFGHIGYSNLTLKHANNLKRAEFDKLQEHALEQFNTLPEELLDQCDILPEELLDQCDTLPKQQLDRCDGLKKSNLSDMETIKNNNILRLCLDSILSNKHKPLGLPEDLNYFFSTSLYSRIIEQKDKSLTSEQ